MADETQRRLESAHAADPTDESALRRLQDWRVRHGLGWFGEHLDSGVFTRSGERPLYEFGSKGGVLEKNSVELVYVPGIELECPFCDKGGIDTGGVTPWGAGIEAACEACRGTGKRTIEPFYLGRFPVTWVQLTEWHLACARGAAADPVPDRPLERYLWNIDPRFTNPQVAYRPAVSVSLDEARAFCEWAGLRLPTEGEWRWAALGPKIRCRCRGASTTEHDNPRDGCELCHGTHLENRHYPWDRDYAGEPPTPERCVWTGHPEFGASEFIPEVARRQFDGSPAPVVIEDPGICPICQAPHDAHGTCTLRRPLLPARPRGASWCAALDMAGNVMEWVEEAGRPAAMGGCYSSEPGDIRAAIKNAWTPHFEDAAGGSPDVGFRVALNVSRVKP